ncbi:MAG: LapA family protein [Planctomycetaceae bacterium]|nr:LapA family protein [Planctomycetaceae bacterium]
MGDTMMYMLVGAFIIGALVTAYGMQRQQINDQQRQIDDLKRELEEMKRER